MAGRRCPDGRHFGLIEGDQQRSWRISRSVDLEFRYRLFDFHPEVEEGFDQFGSRGRIVLAGVKGFKAVPEFLSDLVVLKEVTIHGALGVTSRAYHAAIRLIESGTVPLELIHTHDFPLPQAERAIQILAGEVPGEQSIHSCLVPGR